MLKRKTIKFKAEKPKEDSEEMIIKGYGSVFGNIDSYGDIVVKGAFQKQLDSTGTDGVKIFGLHKDEELPIGRPHLLREDDNGLYMEAKISDTSEGRDVWALVKDGVLDELSIGYTINDSHEEDGIHYLTDLSLQEISVVTWAANPEAKILEYKSKLATAVKQQSDNTKPKTKTVFIFPKGLGKKGRKTIKGSVLKINKTEV